LPVFALFDTMIGTGVTGVAGTSFDYHGQKIAEILERIVEGESLAELGITSGSVAQLKFDARAMQRYGLDPKRLPPEVEVLFESPSLIEAHPVAFFSGLVTIMVQFCWIVALLVARRRQRRAEQKAREMERYFSTVFYENPSPMAVVQVSNGIFVDLNPAWERLYGVTREAAVGRSPVEVGILGKETDPGLYEDFLKAQQSLTGHEREIRAATGERRKVALFSSPVEIAGESLHILTTIDVNDRFEAERLRNNLARDNRIAQLGQISAWIAHEINQPLGSILNNAEAGLIYLESGIERRDELKDIFSDIRMEERRASNVVHHIRSMLGNTQTSRETVPLAWLLEEVTRTVAPEAARRSVQLRVSTDTAQQACVFGDRVLLFQVLLNLVFNAMDAVAKVPMSRRLVVLDCETFPLDGVVHLFVRDKGPGIHRDQADAIFEFFHSTKEGGMGLGLAISRSIVEGHQGELTLHETNANGTCFRIRLPLQKDSI
jgi:PAS domain S-box-containing protein